jgi:hypothetical protein
LPHARAAALDYTYYLRHYTRVCHHSDTTSGITSGGKIQPAHHTIAEVRVRFAPRPSESVIELRLVTSPHVGETLLQVLEVHALNLAAVDLAGPSRGLWFQSPDATELARDFGGSSERTGEECDGSFSSRRATEKGVKVSTAGLREREIK